MKFSCILFHNMVWVKIYTLPLDRQKFIHYMCIWLFNSFFGRIIKHWDYMGLAIPKSHNYVSIGFECIKILLASPTLKGLIVDPFQTNRFVILKRFSETFINGLDIWHHELMWCMLVVRNSLLKDFIFIYIWTGDVPSYNGTFCIFKYR